MRPLMKALVITMTLASVSIPAIESADAMPVSNLTDASTTPVQPVYYYYYRYYRPYYRPYYRHYYRHYRHYYRYY